jgi:uncharacterized membrane protein HdeD (DUF308 family)
MKSEHAFALVALILGIVGGVLLCEGVIDFASRLFEGTRHINIESPLLIIVGVVAIIASAMLWTGRYLAGGVVNIILGIITVFYGKSAEGIMILISGVLGIVAPKIKD